MATGTGTKPQVNGSLSGLTKPSPIRLRLDLFDKIAAGRGWKSDAEKARGIGVDQSVFGRVRRYEVAPGVTFIARVILAFPEWDFADLFVVDEADSTEVAETGSASLLTVGGTLLIALELLLLVGLLGIGAG